MNILITGGFGFIGSALLRYILSETEHSVLNLDKLTYAGNLDNLASFKEDSRHIWVSADICDRAALAEAFETYQPDAIIHLAAESHVDRSIDAPDTFVQTNVIGTYNLLEVARAYWSALKGERRHSFRFHHVSTDEVYGDLPDDGSLFQETTAYAPSSPYSASKAASDHFVRAWGRTYGLPVVLSNCSNNYGPFQFPEKLIPHIILHAIAGQALPVYGDGKQVRDWLYVEDHAEALYHVFSDGRVGETYNIGGHNEVENIEVVRQICQLLEELAPERKSKSESVSAYTDLITFVADRPGHDRRYAIDARKIEGELGWQPKESFASGLRKTVAWYLENEGWWQRVLSGDYQLHRAGRTVEC